MKGLRTIAVVISLLLVAVPAAAGLKLVFARQVEVPTSRVNLSQLLAPGQRLPLRIEKALARIYVVATPPPGQQRTITARRIKAALAAADLPRDVKVVVPALIVVRAAVVRLGPREIAAAYTRAVKQRLGSQAAKASVRILYCGGPLLVPKGHITMQVRLLGTGVVGRVPGLVRVMVDGRPAGQARVVGMVQVRERVVVAVRNLPPRYVIQPEDVQLVEMAVGQGAVVPATSISQVVGQRTRTMIMCGQVLDMRRLEPAPLIRRGQVVTMICQAPGLRVTAKGRAEQTGYLGKVIRLTNLSTRREVYGRVVGRGMVVVDF